MSTKAAKRAQLEALRAARAGGKRTWESKEDTAIFDEVDEEDYRSIVKGRLAEDDFIEEDNGVSGYADNGEDHWDRSSEEEEEDEAVKKARKEAKRAKAKAKEAAATKASARRKSKAVVVPAGANPYIKPQKSEAEEQDFMASIIGDLKGQETVSTEPTYRPKPQPTRFNKSVVSGFKRRAEDDASSFRSPAQSSSDVGGSDPLSDPFPHAGGKDTAPSSDGDAFAPGKKARFDPQIDEDLGGMDQMDVSERYEGNGFVMDVDGSDTKAAESTSAEPAAADDDEDLFVKPAAPAKPKGPPVRRQLVNASAVKIKPEPVEPKLPSPAPRPPPTSADTKAKPKGDNWMSVIEGLASVEEPATTVFAEDVPVDEQPDLLPVPESLQRKGGKNGIMDQVLETAEALEDDGSLRFWWFDYVEVPGGKLMLVGKVRARKGKDAGKWVSAVVTVTGIKRKLHVLPRPKQLDDDGDELEYDDEDEGLTPDDVEADFTEDAENKWGVTGLEFHKNEKGYEAFVKKKYAFGTKGIPREETNWLEVLCDFPSNKKFEGQNAGEIPLDASGSTYSHVFGTNASAFELFVVERKIMGPCWLNLAAPKVKDPKIAGVSWTKLEVEVGKDNVHLFEQDDAAAPKANPPLTIMSLSARTVVHLSENKREMVCASARVWSNVDLDDAKELREIPSSVTTLVRNLFTAFPAGFEAAARGAKDQSRSGVIIPFKDEKAMLTQLLNLIIRHDPDVIVGHDFSALELDVLLNRLKDLKVENFSRIGRFRRKNWPKLTAGRNSHLLNGRLILDLSSDGSQGIIDSTTWSMTEMCLTHLKVEREDIDPEDTPKFFDYHHSTAKTLLHFVMHCEADAYFQMAIAHKVQALPLTRQLTNLAGNSWNKTLGGNRAERNEYILLHRFNEKGYICPDKISSWEKKAQIAAEAKAAKAKAKAAGEEAPKVVQTKKKFTGGLVFEPTKGLWDRYILVMDFNSLYPSIIQEYDIDFSTIDWTADGADDIEKMPERAPCQGEPVGILPQLIASLVSRRRNVKGLMKDRSITAGKRKQYDITQQALKLTANSMYGCLGYEGSRFYALPLASLTTFKGREILTRTKADAEALDLTVIYGDTDSIFINTNQTELSEALTIGNNFKKAINDKYKKLEIDTDAVFERMLLLNKKKYAARKVDVDSKEVTLEIKGLDMKRREYCELSKSASQYVLDRVLSGEATETVIEQIHEYLTSLGEKIRSGQVPLEHYIIVKRLGKNPQDYPDSKSLPHVQVAMRMKAKGQSAKSGDVIPYIFCLPADGVSARNAKAENAHHPDDVKRQGSTLKIDFEVYLGSQVLPPIERLCEPIEGTEKARLAECLGLDVTRYKATTADLPEREFRTLQSQISDAERFKDVESLKFRCKTCHSTSVFDGLDKNSTGIISKFGLLCDNMDCLDPLSTASLGVQLDLQIRNFISKFYEGWLVCDEPTCGNRSRMMRVYGKRCLVLTCRGNVHFEYSDSQLYNQLLYFDSLFDVEKARSRASGTVGQDTVTALAAANKVEFAQLRAVVTKHLDKNGRRWVSMANLFSFVK